MRKGTRKRQQVGEPKLSDVETAESSDNSFSKDVGRAKGFNLKEHYYLSLLVCFAGVVCFYSGYAFLQESL